ncbi:MAG TPA: response regulator transcription factor [Clostridia bacterium]|nr:response regulator transcription factor [Clostridia bacterium]
MATILIVDDEAKIREFIGIFLVSEGFRVLEAANGASALDLVSREAVDLVVLDVMLPDISGMEVCRKMREISDVPIIFLTALTDDDHYLVAYGSGGDGYMTKPVKASILVASIKRMLARVNSRELPARGLYINEASHQVFVDQKEVPLAPKEYELLVLLYNNRGRVLTRSYLLDRIWNYSFEGISRVIDAHIKKLRKKLGPYASHIKTVISVGYKFEEP